jgi:uncharacterized protein (DUF427 family)
MDSVMWKNTGQTRPDFAIEPGPGQESVWDYPRPPAIQSDHRCVEVRDGEHALASTSASVRVLETASPPTFYIPPTDIDWSRLVAAPGSSFCEWKGTATYWALARDPITAIAWSYPAPTAGFAQVSNYVSFYPGRVACFVDGERVRPQPGRYYGGWITAEVVGPFKGDPDTGHW